jgi:hypothetical protein
MAKGIKREPDWAQISARFIVKYSRLAYRDSEALVEEEQGSSALWRLRQCDNNPSEREMRVPAIGHEYCDRRERIIIEKLRNMR